VVIGGNGDDLLTGGDGDDLLLGDNARLSLFEGEVVDIELLAADVGGDDTLEGGRGDDRLYGQRGDDTFVFAGTRLGHDHLVEAGGDSLNDAHDRLDFSRFGGPVKLALDEEDRQTVNRHKGQVNLQLTLSSGDAFEDVTGSPFADKIEGNRHSGRHDVRVDWQGAWEHNRGSRLSPFGAPPERGFPNFVDFLRKLR
jgi:Ca2+-binding RTX toxin-like protein